jgi:hypothetical protein
VNTSEAVHCDRSTLKGVPDVSLDLMVELVDTVSMILIPRMPLVYCMNKDFRLLVRTTGSYLILR